MFRPAALAKCANMTDGQTTCAAVTTDSPVPPKTDVNVISGCGTRDCTEGRRHGVEDGGLDSGQVEYWRPTGYHQSRQDDPRFFHNILYRNNHNSLHCVAICRAR